MDFKSAETILNCSLLFGKVPIFIVGKNGIGKTEMLSCMAQRFKNSIYITELDRGGLIQYIGSLHDNKIKTVVLSDVQTVLARKSTIRSSTFGEMASLMTEGTEHKLIYDREHPIAVHDLKKKKKSKVKKMNFVVAGTPKHYRRIVRQGHADFLNRMIIVEVTRDPKEFVAEGFKLSVNFPSKLDKNAYFRYKNRIFEAYSARHQALINELLRELNAIGENGDAFLSANIIRIYEPFDEGIAGLEHIPIGKPVILKEVKEKDFVSQRDPST